MQRAGKRVLAGSGKPDMRCAAFAPAAVHGEEDFWRVRDECRLLLRCKHQVAVALLRVGESGEDAAADTEVGCAHVRAFFCAFKPESDAAKVGWGHFAASSSPSNSSLSQLEKAENSSSRPRKSRTI